MKVVEMRRMKHCTAIRVSGFRGSDRSVPHVSEQPKKEMLSVGSL